MNCVLKQIKTKFFFLWRIRRRRNQIFPIHNCKWIDHVIYIFFHHEVWSEYQLSIIKMIEIHCLNAEWLRIEKKQFLFVHFFPAGISHKLGPKWNSLPELEIEKWKEKHQNSLESLRCICQFMYIKHTSITHTHTNICEH